MQKRSIPSLAIPLIFTGIALTQNAETFSQRVESILNRPEFRHASFGIEIFSLDTQQPLFTLNPGKLFTPGSTTKLLTEGSALELLGANYRFHTPVYRTGDIDAHGVLHGDLVLVASGDPNLSNRIQPNDTLAFENEDHSYAGGNPDAKAVPGDPLSVIHELADRIAAKGIKEVRGRVLVDTSLFPEGDRELGTGVVISPIVINDNVLDITVAPGSAENEPATLAASPQTAYLKIVNNVKTAKSSGKLQLDVQTESANPDGTYTVTLTGSVPLASAPVLFAYPVAQPSRFAETLLAEALHRKGIIAPIPGANEKIDFSQYTRYYRPENLITEHVSPPLAEEVKVTLKVSQNLHASMTPFILGAVLGKAKSQIEQAGFDQERAFLEKGDLDLTGASQADGAGGAASAFFTPDFMVHYLAYMAKQADAPLFRNALPILGRDGTLADIQRNSPAAGYVFAKTGTYDAVDMLNKKIMVTGKGLAGYTTTPAGQHLAFALFLNRVALPLDQPKAVQEIAGQALGEIAAAAYLMPIDRPALTSEQQ